VIGAGSWWLLMFRRAAALGGAWILVLGQASAQNAYPPTVSGRAPVEISSVETRVYFTPWDDAEGAIMRTIRAAKTQILVQAYSFTSGAIAGELINARKRGIDVRITADQEQTERISTSRIPDLARAGIPVWIETRYQSAHNKTMVIDAGQAFPVVITGSYNWTVAAQRRNSENVLILSGAADLARAYKVNWERHRGEAQPYVIR
jgi:phosphatidylserine/phosphatidylglycerophosphate/cardiolipin synthase-like enzyme